MKKNNKPNPETYVRKHEIVPTEKGFKIIPRIKSVPEVEVKLTSYGFWEIIKPEKPYDYCDLIPLYSFGRLVDTCTDYMYSDWAPAPEGKPDWVHPAVETWAKKKTASAINHRIHDIWEQRLDTIGSGIRELHKKLYSVSGGVGAWRNIRRAFANGDEYLLEDASNYHAARVALLCDDEFYARGSERPDWMLSFAFDDKKYTSLTKTLMNLPRGLAYFDYLNLKYIKLPETVTSRLKLLAYIYLANYITGSFFRDEDKEKALQKVLLKSSDQDIREAVKYMWKYFPSEKSGDFRRLREIKRALQLIFDYQGNVGNWNILGLAKRSEVYHHNIEVQRRAQQEENNRKRAKNAEEYEKIRQSNTALPPIPLPDSEHITFLNTYKAVTDEGMLMSHCIAQYAEGAVKGSSYLFHIDYEGEMASVEVVPEGYVSQSYGIRDSENVASKYGRKELTKWAKKLNQKGKKTIMVKEPALELERIPF